MAHSSTLTLTNRIDPTLRHYGAPGRSEGEGCEECQGMCQLTLAKQLARAVCNGALSIMGIHLTMSPGSAVEQCWD